MTQLTEKQQLSEYRREFFRTQWPGTPLLIRLEAQYGKYGYVPLDVEPILPRDPAAFKQWYLDRAIPISKVRADVAGPMAADRYTFLGVNSPKDFDTIWKDNKVEDLFEHFPEIRDGLKQLPFKSIPEYKLWASQRQIAAHRDQGPWCDLPASFRIMLYDENPESTLYLKRAVPNSLSYSIPFKLPRLAETNVFAWNNLRTKHGSSYDPKYLKILMILSQQVVDMPRFADLLKRSVEKYEQHCFVLNDTIQEYIE